MDGDTSTLTDGLIGRKNFFAAERLVRAHDECKTSFPYGALCTCQIMYEKAACSSQVTPLNVAPFHRIYDSSNCQKNIEIAGLMRHENTKYCRRNTLETVLAKTLECKRTELITSISSFIFGINEALQLPNDVLKSTPTAPLYLN